MNFLIISAFAIFLAVILGGVFALKFKDKLHLILGFSAGSVVGVAFFDLLPEAFESSQGIYDIETIIIFIVAGFLAYMIFDRLFSGHSHHHDDECENRECKGILGAGSLSMHSLVDGLVVGFSFQISPVIGTTLAAAIIAHAFSDGINTVNMIIRAGGDSAYAKKWLFTDAIAPVVGIFLSVFVKIPENIFPVLISVFCGLFLYLGASDLLPESHHNHPKIWTTISTILGMAIIFIITRFAGI